MSDLTGVPAVSGPTRDPALALLKGGSLPGCLAAVVTALASWGLSGGWAGISAAIGAVLSLLAFAVGPLVMRWSRTATAPGVMARAVAAYTGVVLLLGIAFAALTGIDDLVGEAVAAGILVTAAAWLAGQVQVMRMLRLPVYEEPAAEDDGTRR